MKAHFPQAPKPWVDLSTGINPWPYLPREGGMDALNHLPTEQQFADCRQAMSAVFKCRPEAILLAPGSEMLIRLLPLVVSGRRVCVAAQSYGDHASVWRDADVELQVAHDPLDHIANSDILVVCNPNNPDGRQWSADALRAARDDLAGRGGMLVIDEAYADLQPALSLAAEKDKSGLIVLRSFGKFFGLAGLRLGALVASETVMAAMRKRLGVWPVAGPALKIGADAYRDEEWQGATRLKLGRARAALDLVLTRNDVRVIGGTDLYCFVEVPDAEQLWHGLAERGIYVRRFSWSDTAVRIGLPSSQTALQRFDDALREIIP